MRWHLKTRRVWATAIVSTVIALAVGATSGRAVHAQNEPWDSAYPLILTPDRALAFIEATVRKVDYMPGEVVVKFKDGVGAAGHQRALMALRSRPPASDLRWIGDRAAVLKDAIEVDSTILAEQLKTQPEVEYAEPNYLYHLSATPNDPSFGSLQWNLMALDMPRAWDINPGSNSNIVVAVLDSGVTTATQTYVFPTWNGRTIQNVGVPFAVNPDLSANRMTMQKDFAFWSGPVLDMDGHGSHVSSTIGENTNNGVAEAGIAYSAKIMPVKVCWGYWEVQFSLSSRGLRGYSPLDVSGCDMAAVAQGIRYAADNGASVINLSLGGPQPSATLREALVYAVGRGVFVAIAVGNGHDSGNLVEYPSAYAASIDGVMSVGAVGPSLTRAYYSTTGPQVEIVAPGGNYREGSRNGMIWQTTILESDSDAETVIFPRFDRYAETPLQGTSMATPHVSGIAALIISQGVTNPAAVEALIKKTARDLGAPGRDSEYGFGLIQPRAALFGFGIAR